MKEFYIEFSGTHEQDDDRQFSKVVADLRDALRPAGFEVTGEYVSFECPILPGDAKTVTSGPPVEEAEAPIDVPEGGGIIEEAPVEGAAIDTVEDLIEHMDRVEAPEKGMLWIMDPAAWSIDSLKVSIPGKYTESEIRAMLELERGGKGRVGALAVMEGALDVMIEGDGEA